MLKHYIYVYICWEVGLNFMRRIVKTIDVFMLLLTEFWNIEMLFLRLSAYKPYMENAHISNATIVPNIYRSQVVQAVAWESNYTCARARHVEECVPPPFHPPHSTHTYQARSHTGREMRIYDKCESPHAPTKCPKMTSPIWQLSGRKLKCEHYTWMMMMMMMSIQMRIVAAMRVSTWCGWPPTPRLSWSGRVDVCDWWSVQHHVRAYKHHVRCIMKCIHILYDSLDLYRTETAASTTPLNDE